MTISELCKRIEMSTPNLYNIFKQDSIQTKHLEKIADVLNVPITYFFGVETPNKDSDIIVFNENDIIQVEKEMDSYDTIGFVNRKDLRKYNNTHMSKVDALSKIVLFESANKYLQSTISDLRDEISTLKKLKSK